MLVTLLLIASLLVVLIPKLLATELDILTVVLGALLAIRLFKKLCGINMSPVRLPFILMTPINDLPEVMTESIILMTLAMASALPLVALPPVVLLELLHYRY